MIEQKVWQVLCCLRPCEPGKCVVLVRSENTTEGAQTTDVYFFTALELEVQDQSPAGWFLVHLFF